MSLYRMHLSSLSVLLLLLYYTCSVMFVSSNMDGPILWYLLWYLCTTDQGKEGLEHHVNTNADKGRKRLNY